MTLNKRLNLIVCVFLLFAGQALCSTTNVLPVNYRFLQEDDEKQTEKIEKAAKTLRKQAEDRYKDGAYWQAAVDLILILDFYPAYSQKEEVIFLLARSLYEMQMYEGADALYRHLLKSVKRPRLVAESMLGLQKVAFQKSDYQQSLKFYQVLESHYTQHDGIHEARYFAEQTYFNLQNYNLVHNIAAHINKKSAFYPFARYTSGLAHVKKKSVREAIEDFLEVTKRSNKGAERQAIIDEAHLTVGYVYFELSDYKAATRHFLEVTPAFYDHPDALLAAGWAAFKDRDYRAALSALNRLVRDYPDYYNLEEAYFLRGHCHLKLGYYDFAIGEYDRIFSGPGDTAETTRRLNAAMLGLGAQQKRMDELRTQLLLLESKLVQSIPFDADDEHSDGTPEDPQIVQKAREGLIKTILNERQEFDRVMDKITELKREIDKGKMRKKWQAYAEYGKVRALFLRGMISE